jgi:hypothetical protein
MVNRATLGTPCRRNRYAIPPFIKCPNFSYHLECHRNLNPRHPSVIAAARVGQHSPVNPSSLSEGGIKRSLLYGAVSEGHYAFPRHLRDSTVVHPKEDMQLAYLEVMLTWCFCGRRLHFRSGPGRNSCPFRRVRLA